MFKKGHKPTLGMLGKKHSKEWKRKMSENNTGSKNANWRDDDIGKYQRHTRMAQKLGKPNYCEICKRTDKKKYEWSNKDHKYSLKVEDWQRVCTSCHRKYDYKHNIK